MRELILLRHAEAMASAPDGTDAARPLSARGDTEAAAAGSWLAEHQARPTLVLCSPAQRALMTAHHVLHAIGEQEIRCEPDVYDATPGDLLTLLDRHADQAQILLVGHNPGIERLVALLVEGRSQEFRGMPPAALAWIAVDGALEPGNGRLNAFWSP